MGRPIHALAAGTLCLSGTAFAEIPAKAAWDWKQISTPPHVHESPAPTVAGVRAVFFDGLPWEGRPTRVFAYIGIPAHKPGAKVPGIVLVHGGLGTAFPDWVKLWTSRGYAAISMDTCGRAMVDGHAERHDMGGPPGWGGFEQIDWPVEDQWTYHAVADVVLANSLLRAQSDVDPDRIGITGISWGAYLTCIVAGLDDRLRFAVPVYGCGFLGDDSLWLPEFKKMGDILAHKWLLLWDPSRYLPRARMPFLWVDGSNDFAYPLDSLQRSYRLPPSQRTICVRLRMPHGQPSGASPEEIRAFADGFLKQGVPLTKILSQAARRGEAEVAFSSAARIAEAELNFTKDLGPWEGRRWETLPAKLDAMRHTASASIPDGTAVYFFNLIDDRGLVVSSEHVERCP